MSRRKREPKPGEWKYTVGQLTAYERADRGMAVYWRVLVGGRYEGKRRLYGPIRDGERIVAESENEARAAAAAKWAELEAGVEESQSTRFTLAVGFRRFLDERRGRYASDSTWKADVRRHAAIIMDVLGSDLLWAHVRHSHYRDLWRRMAHEHVRKGTYGARLAEQVVGTLQTATRWLQTEELVEPGRGLPAASWRETLKDEWGQITKAPVKAPARPRHTPAEMQALWSALPKADPRLALALEIGAELRLGQVQRSKRSDVEPYGGFRIGAVRVHGRGKKLGELVALTMAQRHALTRAMTSGYLAHLETAYAAGELADYHLITGGHLAMSTLRGVAMRRAQTKNASRLWEKRAMRRAWDALQTDADVPAVPGRGWYGLRRLQSDQAEDVTGDARVLNRLGGWKHTATREKYQQEGRQEVVDSAKAARAKIRPQGKPRQHDTGNV